MPTATWWWRRCAPLRSWSSGAPRGGEPPAPARQLHGRRSPAMVAGQRGAQCVSISVAAGGCCQAVPLPPSCRRPLSSRRAAWPGRRGDQHDSGMVEYFLTENLLGASVGRGARGGGAAGVQRVCSRCQPASMGRPAAALPTAARPVDHGLPHPWWPQATSTRSCSSAATGAATWRCRCPGRCGCRWGPARACASPADLDQLARLCCDPPPVLWRRCCRRCPS